MSYAAVMVLATLGSGHGCYGGEVVYVSSCYGGCYGSCYSSCYGGCYGSSRRAMRRARRRARRLARRCCYDPCAVVSSCYGSCYGTVASSCYGSCYGGCYGTSGSSSQGDSGSHGKKGKSSQSYYRGSGTVTNGQPTLAPVPQEEPEAVEQSAPLPEIEAEEPAEAAPAEAAPQARRRAPATRIVRHRIVPRETVVARAPVRRSAVVRRPVSKPKAVTPNVQVAQARIAKTGEPAKKFPLRQTEIRRVSKVAKSVVEPPMPQVQQPAQQPRADSAVATTKPVRRSLHGVAFARDLARKALPETRRPVVTKTASARPIVPVAKRSGERSVAKAKPAPAQPVAENRLARYKNSTEEMSEATSPIRQVSFETLPETQASPVATDGKKLSVRIAKRRQLRGASERRSRVAHYVSQLQ